MSTTYYVNNTGDDTLNDGTEFSPFLTVEKAISVCVNNDEINIQNILTYSTTIAITKELTITGVGGVNKTTAGDLFLIQANNVTISFLTLSMNATNSADAIINIDRGSAGLTPPNNYTNISIVNNIFNLWKYGIFVNGTTVSITGNQFNRSGGTETLSDIIIYQSNGLTIDNNTVTDTLKTSRFAYLTSSGTFGTTYFEDCNAKSGLMTISNNILNCSSTAQSFILIIQDAFIGANLCFDVHTNDLNLGVAGKVFVSYVASSDDLTTIKEALVHSNNIDISTSGIVHIDAGVSTTLPTDRKYYVYSNVQQAFTLSGSRTGDQNFTQTTSVVFPTDLYLSSIVGYGAKTDVIVTNGSNSVTSSSIDPALVTTLANVIPQGEQYCQTVEYYGSVCEINVTSANVTVLDIDIPLANPLHDMWIYKRATTVQPAGYPIKMVYKSGTNWIGQISSTSNVSIVDSMAVGSQI